MGTQSGPSLDKSHHCEHSADEYQVCLSWSSSFHTEGTGSISRLLSACTFFGIPILKILYHHDYHYYLDRVSLIWCCLALIDMTQSCHAECAPRRPDHVYFCRVTRVVLCTARKRVRVMCRGFSVHNAICLLRVQPQAHAPRSALITRILPIAMAICMTLCKEVVLGILDIYIYTLSVYIILF